MKKQYPFAHNIVIGMEPVPYHAYHKYQRTTPLPTYYGTIFLYSFVIAMQKQESVNSAPPPLHTTVVPFGDADVSYSCTTGSYCGATCSHH